MQEKAHKRRTARRNRKMQRSRTRKCYKTRYILKRKRGCFSNSRPQMPTGQWLLAKKEARPRLRFRPNTQDFPSAESQAALFASHLSALSELYNAGNKTKRAYNIRRPDDIVKAQQVVISDINIIHQSSQVQILRQCP